MKIMGIKIYLLFTALFLGCISCAEERTYSLKIVNDSSTAFYVDVDNFSKQNRETVCDENGCPISSDHSEPSLLFSGDSFLLSGNKKDDEARVQIFSDQNVFISEYDLVLLDCNQSYSIKNLSLICE